MLILGTGEGVGERWAGPTVVVVSEMDELLFELALNLLESLDGFLLGRMGRAQIDGLLGGL